MYPRLRPVGICIRTGSPSNGDHLHAAWSHLVRARELPYERAHPDVWLRQFRSELLKARDCFIAHVVEAEDATACLTGELATAVRRQLAEHSLLLISLESLLEMTTAPDSDSLGELIRSHDSLVSIELSFALHHRRLAGILREMGLDTATPTSPTRSAVRS